MPSLAASWPRRREAWETAPNHSAWATNPSGGSSWRRARSACDLHPGPVVSPVDHELNPQVIPQTAARIFDTPGPHHQPALPSYHSPVRMHSCGSEPLARTISPTGEIPLIKDPSGVVKNLRPRENPTHDVPALGDKTIYPVELIVRRALLSCSRFASLLANCMGQRDLMASSARTIRRRRQDGPGRLRPS